MERVFLGFLAGCVLAVVCSERQDNSFRRTIPRFRTGRDGSGGQEL